MADLRTRGPIIACALLVHVLVSSHFVYCAGEPPKNAAPVVVEMEEGVRLLANMLDCPPAELQIGMPVTIAYEAVTDEVTLPRFRRA